MPNDEWGDFQTPIELVREVFGVLGAVAPGRILEPTCGVGNFLRVAAEVFPLAERRGVELQPAYAEAASRVSEVILGDALAVDFGSGLGWRREGRLLVVGNPPWVTSAALTAMSSARTPAKSNIRGLRGMDALTGSSNFDIAEAIILKLIGDLRREDCTVALLCKTQVARNVLSYSAQFSLPLSGARVYEIDARAWFGAAVDACLFVFELGAARAADYTAEVFASLGDGRPYKRSGVVEGRLVADVDKYVSTRRADGESPFEWRQGIKHDASRAMELVEDGDGPRKKSGEPVDIEAAHLFPLLKCTDVFRGRTRAVARWMVVPQRHTRDDTGLLERTAPRTWAYLLDHAEALDGRKSSIYRGRARFCIFGVGPYSFAPYKVAVSGLHKEPVFRLVAPLRGRPVVFDDATYFAPFDSLADAAVAAAVLDSGPSRALLEALAFTDAKRPITKKLLQRIDASALAALADEEAVLSAAAGLAAAAGEAVTEAGLRDALAALRAGSRAAVASAS